MQELHLERNELTLQAWDKALTDGAQLGNVPAGVAPLEPAACRVLLAVCSAPVDASGTSYCCASATLGCGT